MKKMFLLIAGLMLSSQLKADENLIVTTLLDNVMTVTQFKSGETNYALMDSVVQIGRMNGKSIFDLQAGINGDVKPGPDEVNGANFVFGGFLKVSSLFGNKVNFPDHWRFLNSIEHGPAFIYDQREHNGKFCYQVGLSFGLNPK